MNELEQAMAEAVAADADLGAACGGFLGNMGAAQIQASIDTRSEAETVLVQIASDYAPSNEKTNAMAKMGTLINLMASGG